VARYKPYDYDQLQMIPVSLESQLAPGTLEYAIHQLIEERIDTSVFDSTYCNDKTGRTAYDPKVLLKIVLFAYARGILHSRRMERVCRENVTFMALAYRCGHSYHVRGFLALSYRAPKRACRDCALRSKCLRHPHTPVRSVCVFYGKRPGSLTDAMKAKIDTPEGRRIYRQRLGTVEPVFANVRTQKRMDRFTLRGHAKVGIQWKLYCMVHNIEKILNFGTSFASAVA